MEFTFDNIFSIVQACIALLFIFFLVTAKTSKKLSNVLIALYLIVFVFDTLSYYIGTFIYPKFPGASMLISLTTFFYPSLLYLFVKSSIYRDFKLTHKSFLHALPYVIVNLYLIPFYYLKIINGGFTPEYQNLFYSGICIKAIYISLHALQLIYYLFTLFLVLRYRRLLLENFSNPDLHNFRWLLQLVLMIMFYGLISIPKNIFRFYKTELYYDISIYVLNISVTIFLYWLIIKTLRNPGLFTGIYRDTQLVKNMLSAIDNSGNIVNPGIEKLPQETKEKLILLNNHMATHETYLDSTLSIGKLARKLNMPSRDLSILINHTLNKNFYDFINEYRITKAQEILSNPEQQTLTILEVLYQVGFNSKSSFNTIFKQNTGLTPTQFRKKHM